MSAREPLWFCHECHSEMRPLMVPGPVCASCRSSFVEKMENPSDDPRQFAHEGDDGLEGLPPGVGGLDALLFGLQALADRGIRSPSGTPTANTRSTTNPTSGTSFTFELRGPNGSRTIRVGGDNAQGRDTDQERTRSPNPNAVPTMNTFLNSPFAMPPMSPGRDGERNGPQIGGPLMLQYLMAMLGHRDPGGLFGGPESGRMGDYVFNQEALDEIITQLMENSNAHRPAPATEEVVDKLPREVLEEGSPMLQQDCAVCKDQFSLTSEDPDEQIVITLPCKHPFHQPCILPWLKSSGTCPVCRYALVPQPEQHPTPPRSGTGPQGPSSGRPSSPGPSSGSGSDAQQTRSNDSGSGPGLLHTLFHNLAGHVHSHRRNDSAGSQSSTGAGSGSGSRSPARPQSPNSPRGGRSSPHRPQHQRTNSDPATRRSNANNDRGSNANANSRYTNWPEDLD